MRDQSHYCRVSEERVVALSYTTSLQASCCRLLILVNSGRGSAKSCRFFFKKGSGRENPRMKIVRNGRARIGLAVRVGPYRKSRAPAITVNRINYRVESSTRENCQCLKMALVSIGEKTNFSLSFLIRRRIHLYVLLAIWRWIIYIK